MKTEQKQLWAYKDEDGFVVHAAANAVETLQKIDLGYKLVNKNDGAGWVDIREVHMQQLIEIGVVRR